MGLGHRVVKHAPFTPAMVYLLVGGLLGPWGFGVARIDPLRDAAWLHHAAEMAVIVSLFTVGLKLRVPPWAAPARPAVFLALVSMTITVGLVAGVGVAWLGLSIGAAILLGGIVAPTDPVLASEVQLEHARDRDKVRFTLTTEAGLNDGTAFPFVMLGVALIHGEELGAGAWRWWTVGVFWAVGAGLAIGALLGAALGWLLLREVTRRQAPLEHGEYLVLGLIGVSYAVALEVHAYGFLSVFAAGVALRAMERRASPRRDVKVEVTVSAGGAGDIEDKLASDPRTAPGYVAGMLLSANERIDHLLEVSLVLLVGATLATAGLAWEVVWFAPLLFLVIRPMAVTPLLRFGGFSRFEAGSIAWFGIRGIGSLYYLFYAVEQGLPEGVSRRLISLVMTLVAVSILVHGLSVLPWRKHQGKEAEGRLSKP